MEMELVVLTAIDFRVNFPTLMDLCESCFGMVSLQSIKAERFFQESVLMMCKMAVFSCDILDSYSFDEIVGLTIIIALKITEKLGSCYSINSQIKNIIKRL